MNPIQAVSPEEQNVVGFSESPGRRLRVQRQSRGLEVERIAAQLHLRQPLVEALEQDRYEDLPGPVFVLGYLRNYARLLGLDPEPLVAAYRATNPSLEPPAPRIVQTPKTEIGSGHILIRLVSLALIVTVIGLLVLWWQNHAESLSPDGMDDRPSDVNLAPSGDLAQPAGDPVAETTPLPVMAEAEAPAPASPAAQGEAGAPLSLPLPLSTLSAPDTGTGDQSSATESPVARDTSSESAPAASQGAAGATLPVKSPGQAPTQVALSFSGPTWIDVRDSTGKSVLTREMRKGDRRILEGTPPYSFIIGNATATTLSLDGKPFDLGSRSRGNVARFTLDPDAAE